jgi:hypothetical protein
MVLLSSCVVNYAIFYKRGLREGLHSSIALYVEVVLILSVPFIVALLGAILQSASKAVGRLGRPAELPEPIIALNLGIEHSQ